MQFRDAGADGLSTGPMYYLRDGLQSPALAWIYALVAGVAALTTTPFTQPNSIADRPAHARSASRRSVSGVVLAVLTWLVIIGGIRLDRPRRRKADAAEGRALPGRRRSSSSSRYAAQLPDVLALVVREAFSTARRSPAAAASRCWSRMRYGLARGIYANEAGYGTAAVAYGTAAQPRAGAAGTARA